VVLYSGASKLWNNGDELLKKFIGGDPDGEIEMGAETRSGLGGPRFEHGSSAEAGICRGVVGVTGLTSPEWSRQTEVVVRN